MSGIAGILRRDGRAIPAHWVQWLEKSIAKRGRDSGGSFHDTAETEHGTHEIILIHQQQGTSAMNQPIVQATGETPISAQVIDTHDLEKALLRNGSFASATWDCDTLELHLARGGSGMHPLYKLDLGDAGDGVVFCSNPLPLLWIADELALLRSDPLIAVQHYLQLGFFTGEHTLLAPVQCVPIRSEQTGTHPYAATPLSSMIDTLHLSPSPGEDLHALVTQLGQPFADVTLLHRYWIYKAAKEQTNSVCDDLTYDNVDAKKSFVTRVARWYSLLSTLPMQTQACIASRDWTNFGVTSVDAVCSVSMIQRITGQVLKQPFRVANTGTVQDQLATFNTMHRTPDCLLRGIDGCAAAANLEVDVDLSSTLLEQHTTIPICGWLSSDQSELGSLAGDIFCTSDTFDSVPIEKNVVVGMYDDHRNGRASYADQLFSLLTLGMWLRQQRRP